MVHCVAFGCRNETGKPGVTFHKIPKDSARRSLWVKAIQRKDWKPSEYSRVCSDHFREVDLDRTSLSCVRVRDGAVPSIFRSFPSYMTNDMYPEHESSVNDLITTKQELEMASEQDASSICEAIIVKTEPEVAEPHTPPEREIEYISVKEEPAVEAEPHTAPEGEIEFISVKEEPVVEAESQILPVREVEYISVKEEPVEAEEPGGQNDAEDPLHIVEVEYSRSQDFHRPSTSNMDEMENEDDEAAAEGEDDGQVLKHEVQSASSGSEQESTNPVGVEDSKGSRNQTHRCTGIRPYWCDVCMKTFKKNSQLKAHYRVHTGERPYRCGICNKTFTTNAILKSHSRVHTGERPYRCGICNRTFTQPTCLKQHTLQHTGERPYICDVCHKTYLTKSHLRKHLQKHTGEQPYS